VASSPGFAADKPSILVIMPDDVGWFNVSAYNMENDGLSHTEYRSHCE
jgi:arylsulfatase A-like enzyme